MPTRKDTSNRAKLLSSSKTSTTKPRTAQGKEPSAAGIANEGASGDRADAFSWRDPLNQAPRLTAERAKELTAAILTDHDDDTIVMDLIELLTGIAYEPVDIERDSLAFVSTREAVTFSPAFSKAIASFATKAAMRRSSVQASERTPVFPIFAEGGAQLGWNAARAAGRLCADHSVTLKSATQAFEEEMIAETLRFYPDGGHRAAVHLGMTVGELGKLLRKNERRQSSKAHGAARSSRDRKERNK